MTSSTGWSGLIFLRVAAQPLHGVAHGGQVDDRRHAGEVLEQHPAGPKGDLAVGLRLGVPVGQRLDVVGGDGHAVLVAEQVFQQDLERERQPRDVEPGVAQGVEPVVLERLVVHLEASMQGVEGIGHEVVLCAVGAGGDHSDELYVKRARD